MAGNYTSHEQGDPWAKKSKNMQTDRKPNILCDKHPGDRQKKVRKGGNLGHLNVTFC